MSDTTDWIANIREVLHKALIVPSGELREDARESKCGPVKIHCAGKSLFVSFSAKVNGIAIKDRLFPLFDEHIPGVTRMCDYWIFYEHARKNGAKTKYVFLIELKSGRDDPMPQLENAKHLAQYFVSMASHHAKHHAADVEYRGLVFSPACPASKSGLRPSPISYAPRGRLDLPLAYLKDTANHSLPSLCDIQ